MDNNEKKGKRPRIGESRQSAYDNAQQSGPIDYESKAASSDDYNSDDNFRAPHASYQPRPYQPRQYQSRSYQPRPYQPRSNNYQQRYNDADDNSSNENPAGYRPRQQRPYNANRQGGYRSQDGYSPDHQSNGYQPRPYNNRQGGYRPQGGYNPDHQNNGYQQRPYNNRQGGYRPQGGYEADEQGNYRPRQQRPYNNRQGGYNGNPNRYGANRPAPRQNRFGMPQGGKSFVPRPKRIEYEMPIPDPNEQIRLNKFMANAGICSRREADEFIQQGLVKVNGNVVTELGTKISHNDTVEYDEKVVALERKCYILLNKPKDCVTTSDDPNGRLTVMDLVKGACDERIYPVGRLDRNTTGVLLLTNDGDLASKLTHPKYVKKKIYHVWTDKDISEEDMQRIADGVELDDGPIHADAISYATETDRNQAGIEIHSGRNRIVRRLFESLGYHVTKLDRVYFAGLTKKNLPRGRWRYLTQEEVNFLKMGSFE